MKLIDVASSIKSTNGTRMENISVVQIQRILSQGLREVRAAVQSAGDEVVIVPGLGRFRSRDIELKNAAEGEEAGMRRVTKFVAAKDQRGRDDNTAEDEAAHEDTDQQEQQRAQ